MGGRLEALCECLDLAPLVIIDVSRLSDCRLPPRLPGAAGLLLDRVRPSEILRWRTLLEPLWGVPVVGALPELPLEYKTPEHLPAGDPQPQYDGNFLRLAECCDMSTLMRLADRSELPGRSPVIYRPGSKVAGLKVSVAYDEVFDGYFPGVFDLLEMQGATIRVFSPLRDEQLPPDTDIVYIGGGNPIPRAAQLAGNHCLIAKLREHVLRGRPMYAEAGGLAYLCERLRLPSGESVPMTHVLPAVAIRNPKPAAARAATVTLSRDHWLAPCGFRFKGYLDTTWRFEPTGSLASYIAEPGHEFDVVGFREAVGSRLHLHFAAQPEFLRQFSCASADRRQPTSTG